MLTNVSISGGRLVCLPLSFLAEQELVDAHLPAGDIYYDVALTAVWIYQLHSYHELVSDHYGREVADRVLSQQRAIFDREQPGAGESIETAMNLIGLVLNKRQGDYFGAPGDSLNLPEYRVALVLLLGLPESPDYYAGGAKKDRLVHKVPGIEERLAHLLHQGRQQLLDAFVPLFREKNLN